MKDAAEADSVLKYPVDVEDGVVGLLRSAVGHVVHVKHNLLLHTPPLILFLVAPPPPLSK